MIKTWNCLGILLLLAALAGSLAAAGPEPDPSQMLYSQGLQLERARQYTRAIDSYSQAASLTTTVFQAFISRQSGNCYYYLGLTREALVSYNIYLRTYRRDMATWKLANYLHQWLVSHPSGLKPVPATEGIPPQEAGQFGALIRSAVVPGWGQWTRGDNWRGAAYLAGTAVPFALAFMTQSTADANYEAYKKATDPQTATSLRTQVTGQDQMVALLQSVALGVYVLNLADAFFLTPKAESTAWKPNIGPYAMGAVPCGASLAWSF